jgi:hypothetical protein
MIGNVAGLVGLLQSNLLSSLVGLPGVLDLVRKNTPAGEKNFFRH